jgi:hypothetical protein
VITYRATLDVPAPTVMLVSRWLAGHRRVHDHRPWQRAATPYVQAILVLPWFKDATDLRLLARDARIGIATAYRYLHEAIDVIAAHAPELPDVLAGGLAQGWAFVGLDGTLIPATRSSALSDCGHDLWYSGKHKRHGGNIQVVTGPGTPSGSARSNQAPPTTSPPPAPTPCRRCMRRQRTDCQR